MNIGQASKSSGLNAKTIRYYESLGLVDAPPRLDNGYRNYQAKDIHNLKFLRQARQFGFSLDQCRRLLSLYRDPGRRSAEVHDLVIDKLDEIDRHIEELLDMKRVLKQMVDSCLNDDGHNCSIIDGLSGDNRTEENIE